MAAAKTSYFDEKHGYFLRSVQASRLVGLVWTDFKKETQVRFVLEGNTSLAKAAQITPHPIGILLRKESLVQFQ